MRILNILIITAIAATTVISCNVDNADSPANSNGTADTTTTTPEPLQTQAVLVQPVVTDSTSENLVDTMPEK